MVLACVLSMILGLSMQASTAVAGESAEAAQIDREVDAALKKLLEDMPEAEIFRKEAKGILVFPNIVKGGFMFGAQYGKGALRKHGETVGYYSSVAASYGLQAGVQTFGYAMCFMNEKSLEYLNGSEGWEIGVGPSIVIMDKGMAKSLTTTTGRSDVYAFIFDQQGLMAGLGLQGSKITRIDP
ncbi:MAG TPA: lipid-binding SYLF domain-containing protein [Nitrospiraceae bacterium]